jgi:hypothetical protein
MALTVKCLPTSAHELDRAETRQPFGVVDQSRRRRDALEIEEARQLRTDTLDVCLHLIRGQQRALSRFETRISDQSRAAADERDRCMAGALQMRQHHDDQQRIRREGWVQWDRIRCSP